MVYCKDCSKDIADSYYKRHMKTKRHLNKVNGITKIKKIYTCGIDGCTYQTPHTSQMSTHRKTHNEEREQVYNYKCKVCDSKFLTKKMGNKHTLTKKHIKQLMKNPMKTPIVKEKTVIKLTSKPKSKTESQTLKEPREQKKIKISAISGAVAGAVVAMFIGFNFGGWTTTEATQKIVDETLLSSQSAICVAQFMKQPNPQEKLSELRKLGGSYSIGLQINKEGWDKMPGEEKADFAVARACADGLQLLME